MIYIMTARLWNFSFCVSQAEAAGTQIDRHIHTNTQVRYHHNEFCKSEFAKAQ